MRTGDTKLTNEEEQGYRGWLSQIGQTAGMGNLDKTWTHKSYDLRGLYKKYGPVDIRKTKVPDEFKKEDLSAGPKETEKNWASKKGDSMDSSNPSPLYSNAGSGFDFGNNQPWKIDGERNG